MAYLDRLRERPLEAGATTLVFSIKRGWERCQLLRSCERRGSGRWAADCVGFPRLQWATSRCSRGSRLKELFRIVAENSLNPIDETLRLTSFDLHYGDPLPDARVAFRLVGNEQGPVVVVLGGISAHRIVTGMPGEGWVPEMVGPGLGGDTRQYRVLGVDYIGGWGESSPPPVGRPFPPITSSPPPNALLHTTRLLTHTP